MKENTIVKYKSFESSEDFESYQEENNIQIINIIPMPNEIDMHSDRDDNINSMSMEHCIFVTFYDKQCPAQPET